MLVLDCSVTLAWVMPDETSPYADVVLETLKTGYAIVPPLWVQEVANVLLVAVRRGRLDKGKALEFVSYLDMLDIRVSEETPDMAVMQWLIEFGLEHGLSSYDASYLLLAITEGLPLATLDKRLADVAGKLCLLWSDS